MIADEQRRWLPAVFFHAALAVVVLCAPGCRSGGERSRSAVAPPADAAAARGAAGDPFEADEVDSLPVLVERVPVRVPDPRSGGTSGRVTVRAVVSERGTVEEAEVIAAPPTLRAFGDDVIKAVRQWRFEPALKGGVAVRVWYTLDVTISWR